MPTAKACVGSQRVGRVMRLCTRLGNWVPRWAPPAEQGGKATNAQTLFMERPLARWRTERGHLELRARKDYERGDATVRHAAWLTGLRQLHAEARHEFRLTACGRRRRDGDALISDLTAGSLARPWDDGDGPLREPGLGSTTTSARREALAIKDRWQRAAAAGTGTGPQTFDLFADAAAEPRSFESTSRRPACWWNFLQGLLLRDSLPLPGCARCPMRGGGGARDRSAAGRAHSPR